MFGAKSHSNDSGGNASQERPVLNYSQRQWNFERLGAAEDAPNHIFLHQNLQPLHGARRELPPSLNCGKVVVGERTRAESRSQNVGCGDCVLNREIDSYSSDGRHCVGGIADAQKSRTPPPAQPIDLNRETDSHRSSRAVRSRGRERTARAGRYLREIAQFLSCESHRPRLSE